MEPAALQLNEKETSWKRHIAVSWNALYNRLSVGLYRFPVLRFARWDRNKTVRYILDLYTSHKVPNNTLNPVAKNLLWSFVRFPPTRYSRAKTHGLYRYRGATMCNATRISRQVCLAVLRVSLTESLVIPVLQYHIRSRHSSTMT